MSKRKVYRKLETLSLKNHNEENVQLHVSIIRDGVSILNNNASIFSHIIDIV